MKIALFVHCFFPRSYYGTETYTLAVAKGLAALGHDPTVVSAVFVGQPRQSLFVEEYQWEGIRVLSVDKNMIPHRGARETYAQPAMQGLHEHLLRRLDPDVVHVCHLANHTAALLDATKALGLPTVATLTDFFGFCFTNVLEAVDGGLCSGPSDDRANCIACAVKATAQSPTAPRIVRALGNPQIAKFLGRLLADLGRQRERPISIAGFRPIDLIDRPNVLAKALSTYRAAIAPTTFLMQAYERNGFSAPLLLSRFGVDIDRAPKPSRAGAQKVRLGYVGQLAPHKGVHILVDALRAANRPKLALKIWGAREQYPAYFRRLQDASAGLPVEFAGTFPASEAATVLAGVDFLVIPSTWYENSPLILLQALATHTPAIVSDVPGLTEFVQDGRNGFHFRRDDAGALAAVLRRIADSDGAASEMASGTEYRRTTEDMVRDLLPVYERARGRSRTRPDHDRVGIAGAVR
jgi:glycosyltransferase involved in cell wall biosynthesis